MGHQEEKRNSLQSHWRNVCLALSVKYFRLDHLFWPASIVVRMLEPSRGNIMAWDWLYPRGRLGIIMPFLSLKSSTFLPLVPADPRPPPLIDAPPRSTQVLWCCWWIWWCWFCWSTGIASFLPWTGTDEARFNTFFSHFSSTSTEDDSLGV